MDEERWRQHIAKQNAEYDTYGRNVDGNTMQQGDKADDGWGNHRRAPKGLTLTANTEFGGLAAFEQSITAVQPEAAPKKEKKESKKDKKEQRATFRDFMSTIVDDESPEEIVNWRGGE